MEKFYLGLYLSEYSSEKFLFILNRLLIMSRSNLVYLFLNLLENFEFKKTTPVFFIFFIVNFCEKHLFTLIFLDTRLTYKRSGSDAFRTPSDDLGPENVLQTYKK